MINIFNSIETNFRGKGKIFTASKDSITSHDLSISAQRLMNGGTIYFDKSIIGDSFTIQLVDADLVSVLDEWVTDWPVIPGHPTNIVTEQAGDLPANTYLRIVYTSTGLVDDVKILVAYRLYEAIT